MLTAALVIIGWVAVYIALRHTVQSRCDNLRRELQDQINLLHARTRLLDSALSARPAAAPRSVAPQGLASSAPIAWPTPPRTEDVSPETLAAIAETVTGYLGKKVRIRSVTRLPAPPEISSFEGSESWARQGRILVQSSHEPVHGRAPATAEPNASISLRGVVLEDTYLA